LALLAGGRAGRKKEKKIYRRERKREREREREGPAVSALPLVKSSGYR
jgi:hypothetical protein